MGILACFNCFGVNDDGRQAGTRGIDPSKQQNPEEALLLNHGSTAAAAPTAGRASNTAAGPSTNAAASSTPASDAEREQHGFHRTDALPHRTADALAHTGVAGTAATAAKRQQQQQPTFVSDLRDSNTTKSSLSSDGVPGKLVVHPAQQQQSQQQQRQQQQRNQITDHARQQQQQQDDHESRMKLGLARPLASGEDQHPSAAPAAAAAAAVPAARDLQERPDDQAYLPPAAAGAEAVSTDNAIHTAYADVNAQYVHDDQDSAAAASRMTHPQHAAAAAPAATGASRHSSEIQAEPPVAAAAAPKVDLPSLLPTAAAGQHEVPAASAASEQYSQLTALAPPSSAAADPPRSVAPLQHESNSATVAAALAQIEAAAAARDAEGYPGDRHGSSLAAVTGGQEPVRRPVSPPAAAAAATEGGLGLGHVGRAGAPSLVAAAAAAAGDRGGQGPLHAQTAQWAPLKSAAAEAPAAAATWPVPEAGVTHSDTTAAEVPAAVVPGAAAAASEEKEGTLGSSYCSAEANIVGSSSSTGAQGVYTAMQDCTQTGGWQQQQQEQPTSWVGKLRRQYAAAVSSTEQWVCDAVVTATAALLPLSEKLEAATADHPGSAGSSSSGSNMGLGAGSAVPKQHVPLAQQLRSLPQKTIQTLDLAGSRSVIWITGLLLRGFDQSMLLLDKVPLPASAAATGGSSSKGPRLTWKQWIRSAPRRSLTTLDMVGSQLVIWTTGSLMGGVNQGVALLDKVPLPAAATGTGNSSSSGRSRNPRTTLQHRIRSLPHKSAATLDFMGSQIVIQMTGAMIWVTESLDKVADQGPSWSREIYRALPGWTAAAAAAAVDLISAFLELIGEGEESTRLLDESISTTKSLLSGHWDSLGQDQVGTDAAAGSSKTAAAAEGQLELEHSMVVAQEEFGSDWVVVDEAAAAPAAAAWSHDDLASSITSDQPSVPALSRSAEPDSDTALYATAPAAAAASSAPDSNWEMIKQALPSGGSSSSIRRLPATPHPSPCPSGNQQGSAAAAAAAATAASPAVGSKWYSSGDTSAAAAAASQPRDIRSGPAAAAAARGVDQYLSPQRSSSSSSSAGPVTPRPTPSTSVSDNAPLPATAAAAIQTRQLDQQQLQAAMAAAAAGRPRVVPAAALAPAAAAAAAIPRSTDPYLVSQRSSSSSSPETPRPTPSTSVPAAPMAAAAVPYKQVDQQQLRQAVAAAAEAGSDHGSSSSSDGDGSGGDDDSSSSSNVDDSSDSWGEGFVSMEGPQDQQTPAAAAAAAGLHPSQQQQQLFAPQSTPIQGGATREPPRQQQEEYRPTFAANDSSSSSSQLRDSGDSQRGAVAAIAAETRAAAAEATAAAPSPRAAAAAALPMDVQQPAAAAPAPAKYDDWQDVYTAALTQPRPAAAAAVDPAEWQDVYTRSLAPAAATTMVDPGLSIDREFSYDGPRPYYAAKPHMSGTAAAPAAAAAEPKVGSVAEPLNSWQDIFRVSDTQQQQQQQQHEEQESGRPLTTLIEEAQQKTSRLMQMLNSTSGQGQAAAQRQ